jgi:hypothetical protein
MYIEITTNKVNSRTIPAAKERAAMQVQDQPALLWLEGEQYPDKFKINVPRDGAPLQIGKYYISETSFVINQYGNLELSRYDMSYTMFEDAAGKSTKPAPSAAKQ